MHSPLLENLKRLCATGARKPIGQAYFDNTKVTYYGDRVSITCKKGLWRVDAPTIDEAEREARHYFQQYYHDGEYDS